MRNADTKLLQWFWRFRVCHADVIPRQCALDKSCLRTYNTKQQHVAGGSGLGGVGVVGTGGETRGETGWNMSEHDRWLTRGYDEDAEESGSVDLWCEVPVPSGEDPEAFDEVEVHFEYDAGRLDVCEVDGEDVNPPAHWCESAWDVLTGTHAKRLVQVRSSAEAAAEDRWDRERDMRSDYGD